MPTVIKGQPPSLEIRARLVEEGRPVLVAFSGGKDAIATELALCEDGIETTLAYMYLVPPGRDGLGLRFVDDALARLEDQWQKPIHRYPHPSVYRMLNSLVFQPPERCKIIEDAQLPSPSYEQIWALIREDLGFPADTWVADGVRAADSIVRRASLTKYGAMKPKDHKVSPIADWLKSEVMGIIDRHGVDLPIDYEWFGRWFDGIDYRFLAPLKDNDPEDFQRVLDWYPLAELELIRHGL